MITSANNKISEEYWKKKLESQKLISHIFKPAILKNKCIIESCEFIIPSDLDLSIRKISNNNDLNYLLILIAGISVIYWKYTKEEDLLIISPLANIGDELAIISTKLKEEDTFKDILKKFINEISDIEKHQYFLNEILNAKKPIAKIGLTCESALEDNFKDIDLLFKIKSSNKLKIKYNEAIFDSFYIEQIGRHYIKTLEWLVKNINTSIKYISVIENKDLNLLLNFSGIQNIQSEERNIVDMFENNVAKHPDSVALQYYSTILTYQQLNKKANQLANYIINNNLVSNGSGIAILLNKSELPIIAILATLKTGAFYVPVDPSYPTERIEYILNDASISLVLTSSDFVSVLNSYNCAKIYLDLEIDLLPEDFFNLDLVYRPSDLAYVIYTSGSTGFPKGVMVEHKGVVRLVSDTNYITIYNYDNILQGGSLAFDASTLEIWGALLNGASLNIINKDDFLNINAFKKILTNHNVSIICITPAWFNRLVEEDIETLSMLRVLLIGGDKLSPHHLNKFNINYPNVEVVNGYGPTENTTFTTCYKIGKKEYVNVPIGKPITNTYVYILDDNMNSLPIGVIGEIYTGGEGLSRGYCNKIELTNATFIDNPFILNNKIYKTGDLGRWLPSGDIEFIGRNDEQVKIRGYRIELDEIDKAILQNDKIKDCISIVIEDESFNKKLINYFISADEVTSEYLRTYLSSKLPDFMIPNYFVQIDILPLNSNGKVDKSLLKEKKINFLRTKKNENIDDVKLSKIQEGLLSIWQEILEISLIGIEDDFFDLGGHSLIATQMSSQIYKKFNVEVELGTIFMNSTINSLSNVIEEIIVNDNSIFTHDTSKYFKKISSGEKGNIICFPSITTSPIEFVHLSKKLEDFNLFSFDLALLNEFNNEVKLVEVVDYCLSLIFEHEFKSPLAFIGYSAGAPFGFEIIKKLNEKGIEVSHFIIIDSEPLNNKNRINYKPFNDITDKTLENHPAYSMFDPLTNDQKSLLINNINLNLNLLNQINNEHILNFPFSIIYSEENLPSTFEKWKELSTFEISLYKGNGKHYELLNKDNVTFNANLIKRILQIN